jgi:hypothetical protein
MNVSPTARRIGLILLALTCTSAVSRGDVKPPLPPLRGLQEVDHRNVEVRGGFWGKRLPNLRPMGKLKGGSK